MSSLKSTLSYLLMIAGAVILSSCGGSGDGQTATTTSVTEIPSAVLTLPSGGTLRAFVTIDSGTPIELGIASNTATGSIPNLTRAVHTVTVSFEFTDSGGTTVTVATATQAVDLSSGDASLSFTESDFDLASYDDDGDGLSNAEELRAGTDPTDSGCVLGSSLIGSCTL